MNVAALCLTLCVIGNTPGSLPESLKVEEKVSIMKPVIHAWSGKNCNLHNFHIPALVKHAYFENHGHVDARIPQVAPTPHDADLIAALHEVDGVENVALWPGLASLEFAPTEMRPAWVIELDVVSVLRDHMAWVDCVVINEQPPIAQVESREYQLASFDPLGLRRPLVSVR
jgi:hypothetical protein